MTTRVHLHHGDALEVLSELPADHFDALFCDPPYGLSFMGREWDHGVPSVEVWREALRVLKPGAPLLAFGGTRTFHRLAVAIEDAGFEIRDSVGIAWCYGSGFPKSLDISKAIDRAAGVEREVVGVKSAGNGNRRGEGFRHDGDLGGLPLTYPATPAAERWQGYGTALKPAWEPCVLAMKPLAGTFAENALRHGVAGLNVDGARIGTSKEVPASVSRKAPSSCYGRFRESGETRGVGGHDPNLGRWPANLVLVHACPERRGGLETVTAYDCAPGCAVAEMDRQSGVTTTGTYDIKPHHAALGYGGGKGSARHIEGDTGTASRFFFQATWEPGDFPFRYEAKAPAAERSLGMPPGESCKHPTLKPLSLTAYLAKLLLPPPRDGEPRRLLVPFAGAGSEVIGGARAGWEEITAVELDAESVAWAEARIIGDAPLLMRVEVVHSETAMATGG